MTKELSNQQLAHLLAALRYCQDHESLSDMEHFTMAEGGKVLRPLMDDEINELCEDINCGDINYVGGQHEAE